MPRTVLALLVVLVALLLLTARFLLPGGEGAAAEPAAPALGPHAGEGGPRATELDVAPEGGLSIPAGVPPAVAGGRTRVLAAEPAQDERPGPDELFVRVRNEAGRPLAGVPVVVEGVDGEPLMGPVPSDADGLARLEGFAGHDGLKAAWSRGVGLPRLRARAACDEPPSVALPQDYRSVLASPVELVLPCGGAVVVRLTEADGTPFEGAGTVSLRHVGEDDAVRSGLLFRRQPFAVSRAVEGGEAGFVGVSVGGILEVRASRPSTLVDTVAIVDGPRDATVPLELELRWGRDHPVLRMRLLRPDAEPLASADVRARAIVEFAGFPDEDRQDLRTDAEGRVQIDLSHNWSEGTQRALWLEAAQGGEALLKTLDLSEELAPGLHELGDVTLAPAPLFVAGRVVDGRGVPLGGSMLQLESLLDPNLDGEPTWERQHSFDAMAAADGSFRVGGSWDGQEHRLSAKKTTHIVESVRFRSGDSNVTVRVLDGAVVRGRVLLDEDVPPERLEVHLEPLERAGDPEAARVVLPRRRSTKLVDRGGGADFAVGAVAPGSYRVALRTLPERDEVFVHEALEVLAGEDCRDPALDGIDLRGRLTMHTVTLLVPKGRDFEGVVLHHGPAGSGGLESSRQLSEPSVELLTATPRLDLMAIAQGFRAVRVEGVGGEIELPLEGSLRVRLRFEGDFEPPGEPFGLLPRLVHPDLPTSGQYGWDGAALDERREVLLDVAAPGACELFWLVQRMGTSMGVATMVPGDLELVVADVPEIQEHVVTLSQEQVDELIRRLD